MTAYASWEPVLTEMRPTMKTNSLNSTPPYYATTYGRSYNQSKTYTSAAPISSKDRFKPPVSGYGSSSPARKPPIGPGPLDSSGNRITNNLRPRSRVKLQTTGPVRADHNTSLPSDHRGNLHTQSYGATPPTMQTYQARGRSPTRERYSDRSSSPSTNYYSNRTMSPSSYRYGDHSVSPSSNRYGNRSASPSMTTGRLRHSSSLGNIVSEVDKLHFNTSTSKTTYDSHYGGRSRRASQESITDLLDGSTTTNSPPKNKHNGVNPSPVATKNQTTTLPDIGTSHITSKRDYLSKATERGIVGLRNCGNTCFFNSIVQCLSHCCPLLEFSLDRSQYQRDLNTTSGPANGELFTAYALLMKTMWTDGRESSVSPDKLLHRLSKLNSMFGDRRQHDAQEALVTILDYFHEELNLFREKKRYSYLSEEQEGSMSDSEKSRTAWTNYRNNNNSKIVDLFCGQLRSTLTCTVCMHSSVTFETFFTLDLPIPKQGYGAVDITDCLQLYSREESLHGDNKPFCSKCKRRTKMTKMMKIHRFPRILILSLKRFEQSQYGGYRTKLDKRVNFPANNLDLSSFTDETPQRGGCSYNLFGVSNHMGSLTGGHYTANCKNPYSGRWYCFNDSRVSESSENASASSAYVLFYERINSSAKL